MLNTDILKYIFSMLIIKSYLSILKQLKVNNADKLFKNLKYYYYFALRNTRVEIFFASNLLRVNRISAVPLNPNIINI